MNLPPGILRNIERGLVLDTDGGWIPIREAVAREREIRGHLEKGEVFADGCWVPIEAAPTPAEEAPAAIIEPQDEPTPQLTVPADQDRPVSSDTVLVEVEEDPYGVEEPQAEINEDIAVSGEAPVPVIDDRPVIEKDDTQAMPVVTETRPAEETTSRPARKAADHEPSAAPTGAAVARKENDSSVKPQQTSGHQALVNSLDEWDSARKTGRKVAIVISVAVGGAAAIVAVVIKFLL